MPVVVEMQKVGHSFGADLMEELGPVPCPMDDCDGTGTRVRILDQSVVLICDDCKERAERKWEQEEDAERVAILLRLAGGTERMERLTFESYPKDAPGVETLAVVRSWLDAVIADRRTAPNLYLFGAAGTGKTGVMWPAVKELCGHHIAARIVDFPTLLEQMKNAMGKKGSFEDHIECARVPVLVLDDIGAERPTEWTLGQLHHLVNTRYERCLPTAFVSNYAPGELIEDRLNLGDRTVTTRIVSRMIEGATQHRVVAKDRRLEA